MPAPVLTEVDVSDSVLSSGSLGSSLGLNNIKLESPAYYCTSYTPPCSDNFTTLALPRTSSPSNVAVSLADNSVIRVKRMRRMSSETEEELREKTSSVSELQYYTGSPLQAGGWTQTDIEQATSIGERINNTNITHYTVLSPLSSRA